MKLTQLPQNTQTQLGNLGTAVGANVSRSPAEWVALIINTFLGLLGVVFLILTVYGGFIWMKARGNEKEVERAKGILTDSIIGLVIVFAAYAISSFVIRAVTQ